MRVIYSIFVWGLVTLSSGCAIWQQETTNRGGYLDYLLDQHWLKADSKRMRALRAFAIQVSLVRIASVSPKNDANRQLMAIRVGAATTLFANVYLCAIDKNPLPGAEQNPIFVAKRDPCFYFDSAMVDYSTALFDLAMIALPIEDAKTLMNAVTLNPINAVEILSDIINIGKEALKYGRVVGALYRDTVELEVQVWLATPSVRDRPATDLVTEEQVAPLRAIYARGNDNMPAWLAAIAALRNQGLEPYPDQKFFFELAGLMKYVCGLITQDTTALTKCQNGLEEFDIPTAGSVLKPSPLLRASAKNQEPRISPKSVDLCQLKDEDLPIAPQTTLKDFLCAEGYVMPLQTRRSNFGTAMRGPPTSLDKSVSVYTFITSTKYQPKWNTILEQLRVSGWLLKKSS